MAPVIQPHSDGVYLRVKLQPRASKNEIAGVVAEELKIQVTSPPVDAAANEALIRLLAETLRCGRNAVHLVRGHTSRHKVVFIRGVDVERVKSQLAL